MEQLRRIYEKIGRQLGVLSSSQKLLIGSLCVIALMTLFLVSQYAGSPKVVEIIPSGTAQEQERARTFLMSAGFPAEMRNGKVVVPAERQFPAIAQLAEAQVLPDDTELTFRNLAEKQNMFMPKGQLDQMYMTALTNVLGQVIRNFDGIKDAKVFISNPEPRGIGVVARKPTAQVTVFTEPSRPLDQKKVDALAAVISGAVSGLDVRNVAVIDGTRGRSFRPTSPEDASVQTYIEQVASVEDRVRQKIEDHLGTYISGVVVSVNAIVDGAKRESRMEEALPKGAGSVVLPTSESTSTSTSVNASNAAEPGIASNAEADINQGGKNGSQTNTETSQTESVAKIGTKTTVQSDARGRPTKINVAVSVPREWIEEILRRRGAGADGGAAADAAGPDDAAIEQEWQVRQQQLVATIRPLIDTKDMPNTLAEAGEVVVSLMPVAMVSGGGGGGGNRAGVPGGFDSGGGDGGFVGTLSKAVGSGLIKQAVLLVLAVLALGMMFVMVRKAGRGQSLPSAEELVGIPPALQADSDLVGEADESETAMTGIEVDTEALKTSKMLEEVSDLVKSNPQAAATVFNRWLSTED